MSSSFSFLYISTFLLVFLRLFAWFQFTERLSLHRLRGLPVLLCPAGDLSLEVFTILSSVMRLMCSFQFLFLCNTQSLMLSILHILLISSLLFRSNSVLPAILRTTFISVVSNICFVFEVSGLVSAVYVNMGLIAAL